MSALDISRNTSPIAQKASPQNLPVSYEVNVPPMLWDDTPRTGKSMPIQSHKAGDRSQLTRTGVVARVLEMLHEAGPMTGAQLNEQYRVRWAEGRYLRAGYDSPRKRARELAADGLLANIAVEGDDAKYALTIQGLEQVAS